MKTNTYITIVHMTGFNFSKNLKVSMDHPAYVQWTEQDVEPNPFAGFKADGTPYLWSKVGIQRTIRTSEHVYTLAEAKAIKAAWKAEWRVSQA